MWNALGIKQDLCCVKPTNTIQINHQLDATISPVYLAGRPDHDQQHCYHHVPKVKPEAATAVVELLMMGVRTPETC
jgi:hypothetical protein